MQAAAVAQQQATPQEQQQQQQARQLPPPQQLPPPRQLVETLPRQLVEKPPRQPEAPLPSPPAAPASSKKRTREEIQAERKAANERAKTVQLAALQAEVDGTIARFDARDGADLSKRLELLHVPRKSEAVTGRDMIVPRFHGGLRDIMLDKKSQVAICPIEKVASSELKKLLLRMLGDAKWRDEPWFKGGIHKIKFVKEISDVRLSL